MDRYVIDASVTLHFLRDGTEVPPHRRLVAPTLLRSEVLDALYRAVRSGELSAETGLERLDRFAGTKIRFLGDRVLRRRAWEVAERLGWEATGAAEYVALTQLQADAFVTLDPDLAARAGELVRIAGIEELLQREGEGRG